MTDWNGDRCPICNREWPVEQLRQDCLTGHHLSTHAPRSTQ